MSSMSGCCSLEPGRWDLMVMRFVWDLCIAPAFLLMAGKEGMCGLSPDESADGRA